MAAEPEFYKQGCLSGNAATVGNQFTAMRRCTTCDSYHPNPRCPCCQPRIEEEEIETEEEPETMKPDDITYNKVEELSSELWSIGNMASDLESDIQTGEINQEDACEKFDEIIEELRKIVELYTEEP